MSYRVPESINNCNVYDKANRIVGVTGAVTIPDFTFLTNTISLAGMAGEYDAPVIGQVGSQKMEIPFSQVDEQTYFRIVRSEEDITLRASLQTRDLESGKTVYVPMVVIVRGATTEFKPGSVEKSKAISASITKEVAYIKIIINNVVCVELDKFNSIFVIDNEDLLAKVREQI